MHMLAEIFHQQDAGANDPTPFPLQDESISKNLVP
jgi:hypothetical protein